MYILLLIIFLLPAGLLVATGIRRQRRDLLAGGIVLAASVVAFFLFLDFWGEKLWFDALGFRSRFWTEILARILVASGGAIFSMLYVYFLLGRRNRFLVLALLAGLFFGSRWGSDYWETTLLFLNSTATQLREPILNMTTGFYLFTLPLLDAIFMLLLQAATITLLAAFTSRYLTFNKLKNRFPLQKHIETDANGGPASSDRLYGNSAAFLFILALGLWLQRYHLLYSSWGAVSGPGWTDVHIRLPAYGVTAVLFVLLGCWLLLSARRRPRSGRLLARIREEARPLVIMGTATASGVIFWFIGLVLLPGLFQWLLVEPNEITYEVPYIENNIRFTRHGFRLHEVEEHEFPVSGNFTRQTVDANLQLLNNIRLWDRRALDAVYKQFQEIRLYYEFVGVDIDRYTVGGNYRQVMVSAREMQPDNLPRQSQTFVNRRFKYTHGYGITLTPVSEFTSEGLPNLYIKDIPPQGIYPELNITQPQIYYGELTDSHVLANTSEAEFDYPKGEDNAYIHYPGKGGVAIDSLWRKFLFGWKFDGTRLLLSSYPTPESRILFHRQIRDRLTNIAPFLHFDDDPYIVLSEGKLYWIMDAYTTSEYYPYSEPFYSREKIEYRNGGGEQVLSSKVSRYLDGVNYIRNSVKAVVDAFDGTVHLYVYDKDDPLVRTWRRIFPELFRDRQEMPAGLVKHVRYPTDMLQVQGLVYAKYHMTDPRVFYNQEDLWIRATERYYNNIQPLAPYYVMWEMPGSDELQFVLIQPYTPKNRQVMIGWIAGMCDPGNYGRFLVYKFPKEKRVLGPQQVETKIDQDRFLSGQLTLWDQRGSKVIRGNVLAIPIEQTILYVEPIYLQAETAAYPELRIVVLMHNDNLVYGPTFDQALAKLIQTGEAAPPVIPTAKAPAQPIAELLQKADAAFKKYLTQTGQGKFQDAAESLAELQRILERLKEMVDQ